MQHLDEGTIHSWLDGALSADEAVRMEVHVKECPQCAAAVAEARGFIAGSSRILTALDNAPRGVMPAAVARKRVDSIVWRVAATVLVVAAGTLVVVRNRGADEQLMSAKTERVTLSSQPSAATEQAPPAGDPASTSTAGTSPKAAGGGAPAIARSGVSAQRTTALAGQPAGVSGLAGAPTSQAPTFAPSRVTAIAAMDAAAEPERLKVVGSPQRIGANVTLYEVTPGDTVTLTESIPISLNSIVVRGAIGAPMAQQSVGKSAAAPSKARADAATTVAQDSQRAGGISLAAPAVSAPVASQVEMANQLNAITWTDPITRTTLTLSGRMSEARLQELRIRIDRERAAAAAKKNP